MNRPRLFHLLGVFVFLGCLILTGPSNAQKTQLNIKRTYYDYHRQRLHEEYQFIRTANKLEVKNGYYKKYRENGVIKERSFYRNDELNGVSISYEDFGNGPEPFSSETYKSGERNGYSTIWTPAYENGPRVKSYEGNYINDRKQGRHIDYESDGSRKVTHYQNGIAEGKYAEYDPEGTLVVEGYLSKGQWYTGTIEETFANGKPKKSVEYERGGLHGVAQTWYANGELKTQASYTHGSLDGTTMRYTENGQPDAATKIILAQMEQDEAAESAAERADSIKQAPQKLAAAQLFAQRRLAEEHRQDSVKRRIERIKLVEHQRNDSIGLLIAHAAQALSNADPNHEATEKLMALAKVKQAALLSAKIQDEERTALYDKLIVDLYYKLWADYQNCPGADKLVKAQRLLSLMDITESIYRGELPELKKVIYKEKNLKRILAQAKL